MDLLPLELNSFGSASVGGPAPSDSSEFFEELLRAERTAADDSPPPEENLREPAEPAESLRPERPSQEPDVDTSLNTGPAGSGGLTEDPPTGHAPHKAADGRIPAIAADPSSASSPQPANPLRPVLAAQDRPAPSIEPAGTPLERPAQAARHAAPSPLNSRVSNDPGSFVKRDGFQAVLPQSQPTRGTAPGSETTAPTPRDQSPGELQGLLRTQPGIQAAAAIKEQLADSATARNGKAGQTGKSIPTRRSISLGSAAGSKAAPATVANAGPVAGRATPNEATGGTTPNAPVNTAPAPGLAATAFGTTLPAALPQSGGVAESELLDIQTIGRRSTAVDQVAVRLKVATSEGQDRISIRLHPAELGRVEVKLDLTDDRPLRAILIAERSETLELLQRDARHLERTLEQAGLKLDSGSLNFGLQNQADNGASAQANGRTGSEPDRFETEDEDQLPPDVRSSVHDGVLDLII